MCSECYTVPKNIKLNSTNFLHGAAIVILPLIYRTGWFYNIVTPIKSARGNTEGGIRFICNDSHDNLLNTELSQDIWLQINNKNYSEENSQAWNNIHNQR